jgi:acyl-CoA thioesterase FadM
MGEGEPLRFVTASLKVEFLRPTPLGPQLELRATVGEIKGRKVVVMVEVMAEGQTCVRGEVVAVQMPQELWEKVRLSAS